MDVQRNVRFVRFKQKCPGNEYPIKPHFYWGIQGYTYFSNYYGTSVRTASAIGGSLFNLCWSKNEKYKKKKKKHFETEKKNVFTVWVRFRKFIRIIYVREAYAP